jgi:hypothetical protein
MVEVGVGVWAIRDWQTKGGEMSATVPFIALSALIALSLSARQAARLTVNAPRQYATATLAFGLLMSFWIFS